MQRLISTALATLLISISPFAQALAAPEDAVRVLKIDKGVSTAETSEQSSVATVTLRIRDLGPEKDVGIVINTELGETYQPGIYVGTGDYGYEIWKVDTEIADHQTIEFLGLHRIGEATYIDDNEGAFYTFTNLEGSTLNAL